MKTRTQTVAKRSNRVHNQTGTFELKQKVILALNRLADRDTYQIGVEELEKTARCLTPDGISPFLHWILDTDSEQKSAVRKVCIRLMGVLSTYHAGPIGSHLGKMVASIVKRLKDPDTVVRDACVETIGVLASKLANGPAEVEGGFVVMVKPLFEALGEQNKQVQMGSSLCLAKIIDNASDPPVSILQQMLARTVKLLKNPHFMAKPAVIELNRSIIQAGGASTQGVLSAAMNSVQEALKSSDWTTRKAASVALGDIALRRGSFLASYKDSCIDALESCRFDRVKPVRDTIQQALQHWKNLLMYNCPELSEAGSSIKDNSCQGDFNDVNFTSDSPWKGVLQNKDGRKMKSQVPPGPRNTHQNSVANFKYGQGNDWHNEIAVPRTHGISLVDVRNEEFGGSSSARNAERLHGNPMKMQDEGYVYVDDKQALSSVSNFATDSFETKSETMSHDCYINNSIKKPMKTNRQFIDEEVCSAEIVNAEKTCDHTSLGSTLTDSSYQNMHGFCMQTTNEMALIRKQLLDVEIKQSTVLELLQASTSGTMERLSAIQDKVSCLETVVERVADELFNGSNLNGTGLLKNPSQRQPLVDVYHRQPSFFGVKNTDKWKGSRPSASPKKGIESWMNTIARKPVGNDIKNASGPGMENTRSDLFKKGDSAFAFGVPKNRWQNDITSNNSLRHCVNENLCKGDFDAAYVEALCSGNELIFIELLDRTGPVLERLSQKTIGVILGTLVSYLLENKYMNSIIPWLLQVVDLSTIHGPVYLIPSANARQEFLSAMQEALNLEFSNLAQRKGVAQLVNKLQQIWGKCC